MAGDTIGIYIHVPYCRVLCPYCDFVKRGASGRVPQAFVDALCTEIQAYDGPNRAGSVFFGGGTPSMLETEGLALIFETLDDKFATKDPEITLEANPDDVTEEKLSAWRDLGVNRISLGVQSFDDITLHYLGRCHDAAIARRACSLVAGHFDNWGLDLIFGAFPNEEWEGRGRASFAADLEQTLHIGPPHVSVYGLTFEEGTPFYLKRGERVDDDMGLELYRMAMDSLGGYEHYEVSNFAREGFQSRHNKIYWRNGEYAGFGPGSVSYVDNLRSRNARAISGYLLAPGKKSEVLNLGEREVQIETLIQHFRTKKGLDKSAYEDRFGASVREGFGAEIDLLVGRGLLNEDKTRIRPTKKGFELNDEIGLAVVG